MIQSIGRYMHLNEIPVGSIIWLLEESKWVRMRGKERPMALNAPGANLRLRWWYVDRSTRRWKVKRQHFHALLRVLREENLGKVDWD